MAVWVGDHNLPGALIPASIVAGLTTNEPPREGGSSHGLGSAQRCIRAIWHESCQVAILTKRNRTTILPCSGSCLLALTVFPLCFPVQLVMLAILDTGLDADERCLGGMCFGHGRGAGPSGAQGALAALAAQLHDATFASTQ